MKLTKEEEKIILELRANKLKNEEKCKEDFQKDLSKYYTISEFKEILNLKGSNIKERVLEEDKTEVSKKANGRNIYLYNVEDPEFIHVPATKKGNSV